MKNLFKSKKIAIIAFMVIIGVSCKKNDAPAKPTQSITEIAVATPNLSILVAALTRAKLASTLSKSGTYTVFAPTNDAFAAFLKANNFAKLEDVPLDLLESVLLNHVIGTTVKSSQLTTSYVKTLAKSAVSTNTLSLFVNVAGGKVVLNGGIDNGGAMVKNPDIMANNGVIHIVDGVIGLPTIVTHAAANPNFTTLVAALKFNPASGFIGILSGTANSPFTVFAPTNTAFGDFLTETKYADLAAIPAPLLATTLKYHVVTEANVLATSLKENQIVNTFAGQEFTVMLAGGAKIKDANNRLSNIVFTDVQCNNGVIHVLDKVLLAK